MTRQTLEGKPEAGFVPEQRLTFKDALRAYTYGAAYAEFAEKVKGTLAPGMMADLVVWDRDVFSLPVQQVKNAKIVKTIYDGQVVFEE